MGYIFIFALAAWVFFGSPLKAIANLVWDDSAAPWESVDAYYYPDRSNLANHQVIEGLGSVQECRDRVNDMAANNRDPRLVRGDYECAIQKLDGFQGISVYRTTVR